MPTGRLATIKALHRVDGGGLEATLRYEDGDTVRMLAKHLRGLP